MNKNYDPVSYDPVSQECEGVTAKEAVLCWLSIIASVAIAVATISAIVWYVISSFK